MRMDLKKKKRKKLLLEKPQDRSAKAVYQKRKWEEKSIENPGRGKSKVYIEKNEVEWKKNGDWTLMPSDTVKYEKWIKWWMRNT